MSAARTWCVGAALLALVSHVGNAARAAEPEKIVNSVGMPLVAIPAGQFAMGAPESEAGSRIDERPVHEVRITKPFYLGQYEVTQAEYQAVTGINPSYFSAAGGGSAKVSGTRTDRFPVEQVSWEQAIEFCRLLSARPEEIAAGRMYRLPTEAEWQYACRAGTTTPFHYGESLSSKQANINGNFPYGGAPRGPFLGRTCPVGLYQPNAFGLYDMHGNVAEMMSDWYARHYYKDSPGENPTGAEKGGDKVVLGGSWGSDAARCRCAYRRSNATSGAAYFFGLRVACDVVSPEIAAADAAKRAEEAAKKAAEVAAAKKAAEEAAAKKAAEAAKTK